jgi:hypothetical protein
MDQSSLVTDETDAGADLVRRLNRIVPVQAAFWLKESEDGPWYLYVASDRFDYQDLRRSYGEMLEVFEQMPTTCLDPLQVKLVPTSDPLAQAALDINRRYPVKMPTRFGGAKFGGMGVEGVYIYPDSVMAPSP